MNKTEMQNLIKELIEKITISVNEISVTEEPKTTWFRVEVKEPHLFLGREGEGLFALNHLARKMIETRMFPGQVENRVEESAKNSNTLQIMIDINGFQRKRVDNLHAVAHMMAERARYFKSNIEVDPMPAFERRVVHEFLSDANDLTTESIGVGPSRRVVIKYVGII